MPTEPSLHRACDCCRRKKARCDSVDFSCTVCRSAGHACTFNITPGKRGPKGRPRRRHISHLQGNYGPTPASLAPSSDLSQPALSPSLPRSITVLCRYQYLSDAVSKAASNASSSIRSLEEILLQCTDLFFSYIVPFNMSVHEPSFRRSVRQSLSASPPGSVLTLYEFTLLTAVCAKTCFFMPTDLFPIGKHIAELFLNASQTCLAEYAESDQETPRADSITIRYLHSNCLHTNAKPIAAWHGFGEALRLVQRMRLHDEGSYTSLDPVEAEMRRRAFWQVYCGDKSLAVLRSMPMTLIDYSFEDGISARYPSSDNDGLTLGTNAGIQLWRYAADLILRIRVNKSDKRSDPHAPLSPTERSILSDLYIRFATCLDDLPSHLLPESVPSSSVSSDEYGRSAARFAVQTADLHTTYHCLKMYVTQQLEGIDYFSHTIEGNEMLLLQKTEIARDMVRLLQSIPFWSLQISGEPCAEKIRLVGASLLAMIQEPSCLSPPLVARARRDFNVLLDILSRLDSRASESLRQECI